jgi:hypothetical protein
VLRPHEASDLTRLRLVGGIERDETPPTVRPSAVWVMGDRSDAMPRGLVNRVGGRRYADVDTRRVHRLLGERLTHATKSTVGMPTTEKSCEITTARSLR